MVTPSITTLSMENVTLRLMTLNVMVVMLAIASLNETIFRVTLSVNMRSVVKLIVVAPCPYQSFQSFAISTHSLVTPFFYFPFLSFSLSLSLSPTQSLSSAQPNIVSSTPSFSPPSFFSFSTSWFPLPFLYNNPISPTHSLTLSLVHFNTFFFPPLSLSLQTLSYPLPLICTSQ